MTKLLTLLTVFITLSKPILAQLDSTYRIFQNQTGFSYIHSHNGKYSIVGNNLNSDGTEPLFRFDLNAKLQYSKETKAKIAGSFKNSKISKNTIDGSYLAIVYEEYYSPFREIYKVDSLGNILFHRSIADDSAFYPAIIIQTSDSGYLVTGYNITSEGYYSAFLLKVNSKGNIAFYKNFTLSPPYSILGFDIVETKTNYFLLTDKDNESTPRPNFEENSLIYKLNKNGDTLASINETKGNINIGYSNLLITDNQELLYNGHIIDTIILDTLASKIHYLTKPFIRLRSSNGADIWQKTFSKSSNKWDGFNTIKKLKDGNYLAVGYIYNPNNTDSSNWGYAVKISKTGNVIWEKKYRTSFVNKNNSDKLFDFVEETDGNLIFVGSTYKPFINDSSTDFANAYCGWAFKSDNQGNKTSSIVSKNPSSTQFSLQIFPNPSIDFINVEYSSENSENANFGIYNTEGKLVSNLENKITLVKGLNKFKFDITQIPIGIYFLQVTSNDGRIENIRFEKTE